MRALAASRPRDPRLGADWASDQLMQGKALCHPTDPSVSGAALFFARRRVRGAYPPFGLRQSNPYLLFAAGMSGSSGVLAHRDAVVRDARTGAPVALGELWAERPVVLGFLRRLG